MTGRPVKFPFAHCRALMFGLAAAVALSVAFAASPAAPSASAAASSCSKWGSIPYYSVPTGYMCFTVTGDGLTLKTMRATWRTTTMCNWRFDWVIYYKGKVWWSDKGPTNGCSKLSGGRVRSIAKTAPHGSEVCAQLVNTARERRISSTCHGVSR